MSIIQKNILNNDFKLENDKLYKLNKNSKEWRNLSDTIKVDKYNHQTVSIMVNKNQYRGIRLENLIKKMHDDNYNLEKTFRT